MEYSSTIPQFVYSIWCNGYKRLDGPGPVHEKTFFYKYRLREHHQCNTPFSATLPQAFSDEST